MSRAFVKEDDDAGFDKPPSSTSISIAVGEGVSIQSPLGRALLGAEPGDVRELRAPKGTEEVLVVALEGEAPST